MKVLFWSCAICLVSLAAAGEYLGIVNIVSVTFATYPPPAVGGVVSVVPQVRLNLTNLNPNDRLIKIGVFISDDQGGHADAFHYYTIAANVTEPIEELFTFAWSVLNTWRSGSYEVEARVVTIYVSGNKVVEDLTFTHTITVSGDDRAACEEDTGMPLLGGVVGNGVVQGPEVVFAEYPANFTALLGIVFRNTASQPQKVPFKVHYWDQEADHERYIYINFYAPANCFGRYALEYAFQEVYDRLGKQQWFGWCALCDFRRVGRLNKFYLPVIVVEHAPYGYGMNKDDYGM